jgi:hypothetical protein
VALAVHEGGPADGATLAVERAVPVRYHLPAPDRQHRGWLTLARYVFVPPRDGPRCRYRYTGTHQVQGPVPAGEAAHPDWS